MIESAKIIVKKMPPQRSNMEIASCMHQAKRMDLHGLVVLLIVPLQHKAAAKTWQPNPCQAKHLREKTPPPIHCRMSFPASLRHWVDKKMPQIHVVYWLHLSTKSRMIIFGTHWKYHVTRWSKSLRVHTHQSCKSLLAMDFEDVFFLPAAL